jgi:hypothetical protein
MQNPIEVYDFRVLRAWDQGLRVLRWISKLEGFSRCRVFFRFKVHIVRLLFNLGLYDFEDLRL